MRKDNHESVLNKALLIIGKLLIFIPALILVVFPEISYYFPQNGSINFFLSYTPYLIPVGIIIHIPKILGYIKLVREKGFMDLIHAYNRRKRKELREERKQKYIQNLNSEFPILRRNDSIAKIVKWSPISNGGASFQTSRLLERDGCVVTKPTLSSITFNGFFISLGLFALIRAPFALIGGAIEVFVFLLLWGSLFFGFGYYGWSSTVVAIFDKKYGQCTITQRVKTKNKNREFLLEDIIALQVIGELIQSSGNHDTHQRSYSSYELNFILSSGKRVNVIDSGDLLALEKDAVLLSDFLKVPAWKLI